MEDTLSAENPGTKRGRDDKTTVYRHAPGIRVSHWINVVVITIMLMSGLQIFNAHPKLYWGSRSDADKAWLSIGGKAADAGGVRGFVNLFGIEWNTTGIFGVSSVDGTRMERAFPDWATLPGVQWLAMGRRWHFFFAWFFVLNGLFYVGYSIVTGHLWRDLIPSSGEMRGIARSIRSHLSLRGLRREAEHGYNVLQKLSYLLVVFVLGTFIVLTGLTMSPWLDAGFPVLLQLFGGRQTARSIHFLAAFSFVIFFLVHITTVFLVGPLNHIRAMISGRLRVRETRT